ncbi:MAG: hypothetical protein PWQ70_2969 [Clostridiales bacterium]|nr:hypothetical protein [Clostridiales bacterium]
MKDQSDRSIYIPISFEHLLSFLFGEKSYHGFVGIHEFGIWKKNILKIFRAIKKSILVNINIVDELHKTNLIELCNDAISNISKTKNKDKVNVLAIEYMTKIIFSLQGDIPDNWRRNIVNRDEYWKLNKYRQIVYTQNQKQKVNIILSLHNKYPYSERFADKLELINKYGELEHNDSEFIKWFKGKYPELYLELF